MTIEEINQVHDERIRQIHKHRDEKLELLDHWYRRSIHNLFAGFLCGLIMGAAVCSLLLLAAEKLL